MSDALGLSVGTMNLVAARPGRPPVSRPAASAAAASRGFVERVGDPVPIVAAGGSAYRGETLLTLGLEALARSIDPVPPSAVVVAVPAYWSPAIIGALRGALRTSQTLSPDGAAPLIVSDAAAALTALRSDPGLPSSGVVALCDFGAGGTSITLVDAGADLAPVGETMRVVEFAGDQIDQALLNHVLTGLDSPGTGETAATAAVGSLTSLREECRLAKEGLSADIETIVPVELPGYRADVVVTRTELESLTSQPLDVFLDALGDVLERNGIPGSMLSATVAVGGGAAMPLIVRRLSETLRVPVITRPEPGLLAAAGAALLAARGTASDSPTSMAPAAADAPTGLAPAAADALTGLAPAAWAASTASRAASESASDGSPSATYRALAWSQDDDATKEPVPYAGEDYRPTPAYSPSAPVADPYTGAGPTVDFGELATAPVGPPPLPWYRRPALIFGIAATLAAVAVGGLAIKLTDSESTPTTTTTQVTKPGEEPAVESPAPLPAPTVTGGDGQTTVTTAPQTVPPIPPPTSESTSATTTSTTTTTRTTTPTTTTASTTPTSSTTPTTSTTTAPTTTTATTPTTTSTTSTSTTPTTTQPPVTTPAPATTATTASAPLVTTTGAPAATAEAVVPESAATTGPAPVG